MSGKLVITYIIVHAKNLKIEKASIKDYQFKPANIYVRGNK